MKRISPVLLLQLLFLSACSLTEKQAKTPDTIPAIEPITQQSQTAPTELLITQKDYGDKWPFTKEKGILTCKGANKIGEVILTAEGVSYAVNGIAKGTKKYQPLDKIWADNAAIPGTKKNLGDIIEKGLTLCR